MFDDDKDVLLYENDVYRFYKNYWTRTLTKKLRTMDIHGIEFPRYGVVKFESKSGNEPSGYLIWNDKGEPIYDSSSWEEISNHIEIMKYMATFDNDIVSIAERLREEKKEEEE